MAGWTREPHPTVRGRCRTDEPVLVVDDDPVCCRLMASALAVEGFRVEWTTDPLRALDLLRDRRYALLVSDVNMPQMLGTRLAAEVRKVHPDVQVLLVTAFADQCIRREAEVLGTTLLSKPVRVDALAAAARELLETCPLGRAAL